MEPSNDTTSINTTHLPHTDNNNSYPDFLGGIHNFATSTDHTGNDDIQDYFHPDLFDTQDASSTPQQQQQQQQQQPSQNYSSAFNQQASRQSHSPALPAYNPNQHAFTQHPQFTQQSFDPRSMFQSQQSFDPRFYQQRPSQSPAPLDHYPYQNTAFQSQNYHQQPMNMQQRQSSTPTPAYTQNQQSYSPFINFDSRNSPQLQNQSSHMMQFNAYQEPTQRPSQSFVDPSMLNASQGHSMNGYYPQIAQRPLQPSPYFSQAGPTIDPRSLQAQQLTQPNHVQALQQPNGQGLSGLPGQPRPELTQKQKAPKDPNAPKRPRGRPRKDGTMPRQGGQKTESDSDSGSDLSVEEEPEKTPALLSVQMPTDEKGKAMYQAVQAVWSPRNLTAPVEKIKSGMAQFGDTIKGLRDSWKDKNESLRKAELPNAATAGNIPQLKADVAHYRQIVETVVNRSLQHGHPAILKRLGENQWTMSALYAFMLDRVTAGDLDGTLVISILKLAVNFETVDEEKLEATKWPKLLQRLTKKATTESRSLAQTVLTNATAATAKKKAAAKAEGSTNGDLAAGFKRSRDGEVIPTKKTLVKPSSKPLALQNAERRRAQEAAEAAKKTAKPASGANGAAVGQKAKVVVTQPPKAASFASLMSASKRPGTSNAERAAAGKEVPKAMSPTPTSAVQQIKREPVKRESPPLGTGSATESKQTSSFKGFLSALEKKEEVKPKKVEEYPNETPDQKEKRLRKESRRKLRVSWKAEPELVETKYFTHDPEEEIGHTDNSVKDVGDTMKEGEMLKLHKGMDDLDDEDDQGESELAIEYAMPTEVDLSEMKDALGYNGIKFGGPNPFPSPSRDAQEKLEANTVMVVYASQADRPESPKEPSEEGDDSDFQPCVDFGPPPDTVRTKEGEVFARARNPSGFQAMNLNQAPQAGQIDLQSIMAKLNPQSVSEPQTAAPAGFDLQKLVASVAQVSQQMKGQGPPPYQPPSQPATAPSSDLSSLLATFQNAASSQGGGLASGNGSNPNPYPGAEKHGLESADYGQQKSGKKKKGNNYASKGDSSLPSNYKTLTCQFWLDGKCNKGDHCTYRHDRLAS